MNTFALAANHRQPTKWKKDKRGLNSGPKTATFTYIHLRICLGSRIVAIICLIYTFIQELDFNWHNLLLCQKSGQKSAQVTFLTFNCGCSEVKNQTYCLYGLPLAAGGCREFEKIRLQDGSFYHFTFLLFTWGCPEIQNQASRRLILAKSANNPKYLNYVLILVSEPLLTFKNRNI